MQREAGSGVDDRQPVGASNGDHSSPLTFLVASVAALLPAPVATLLAANPNPVLSFMKWPTLVVGLVALSYIVRMRPRLKGLLQVVAVFYVLLGLSFIFVVHS